MLTLQSIWILATLYLIIYDLVFHFRLIFYKSDESAQHEPVSVVICAKNEEENLKVNLPLILGQDYEQFEVILVDDASTDNTALVLKESAEKYPNLKLITIGQEDPRAELPGKKAALGLGIAAAAYDIILLTDADCQPVSDQWIAGMSSHFDKSNLVLGYSPFKPKASLAGYLSAWDNMETAMQYFGFALAGYPYMGVGRNLAYRKSLYRKNRPLGHEAGLASGDDDLQVGAMADPQKTSIEVRREFRTISLPMYSFNTWWKQKRRHLSTAVFYEKPVKQLLGAYGAAKLLFYILIPILLILKSHTFILWLFIFRILLHYLSMASNAVKLQQWRVIWLFPLWESVSTIFQTIIHIQNLLKPKTNSWN